MGIACYFVATDKATIKRLIENPDELEDFLFPEDEENEPANLIDVDKAWHGIHYLLTGKTEGGEEPWSSVIFGGEEVGDDIGYGPVRVLGPSEVQKISAALNSLTIETISSRFNAEQMEKDEVYPDGLWVGEGQGALEYVLDNYQNLVTFYANASVSGNGILLFLA